MDNPTTITVIGSIIAAIVLAFFGFWAGNVQKKQSDYDKADLLAANKTLSDLVNKKNQEIVYKSDELTRITKNNAIEQIKEAKEQAAFAKKAYLENKESSRAIQLLQDDQIKKTEEIARLSTQLSELSTETLNSILGRDSYCYLKIVISEEPKISENKKETADVYIFHSGKYTLKNIRVSIVNTDEESDDELHNEVDYSEDPEMFNKTSYPYIVSLPLLLPNQWLRLKNINIFRRKQKSFKVFFSADNGFGSKESYSEILKNLVR